MSRMFGTVVRGVRAPIFREGDDVVKGTVDTVLKALKENSVEPHDKDVVAITESVVARTQGNYATVEQIAADVKARTGGKTVGVTFPILSRNRCRGGKHFSRRQNTVYLTVGGQSVHPSAGGTAAGTAVFPPTPRRHPDRRGPGAVRLCAQRHQPHRNRRGKGAADPGADDG